MDDSHLISLTSKRLGNRIRQYRHSVFASLPVAEHDLIDARTRSSRRGSFHIAVVLFILNLGYIMPV